MARPTTMRPLRLLAVAATAGVLAACGSSEPDDETVLEPGPANGSETSVDITGTTWNLDQVEAASGDTATPEEEAYVEFTDDGRLEANSGCNSYGGEAEVDGDQVTLGEIVGTMRACEGATGQVDSAFGAVLQGTITAAVSGDTLTLTNADGAELVFSAA